MESFGTSQPVTKRGINLKNKPSEVARQKIRQYERLLRDLATETHKLHELNHWVDMD